MKKADLIISADWHLREKAPVAWTGDFFDTLTSSIKFIDDLQKKHNCPVAVAGDIFDNWNPNLFIVAWIMKNLPNDLILIPGQHDLPHHNLTRINRTALNVLNVSDKVNVLVEGGSCRVGDCAVLHAFPWGVPLKSKHRKIEKHRIALCHIMTFKNKIPFPGCTADTSKKLMKRLEGFDLIITGDNHVPFTDQLNDQILVNPGSLMRLRADQIEHKPRVYLWYADTNEVIPEYLPINYDDLSRTHIDIQDGHDERISAFVEKLQDDVELSLSFENNLKKFMSKNKTKKEVRNTVWEMFE